LIAAGARDQSLPRPYGEQHRLVDSHRMLVHNELLTIAFAVNGVLVYIDHGIGSGCPARAGYPQESSARELVRHQNM
jgi:hypothetical protein